MINRSDWMLFTGGIILITLLILAGFMIKPTVENSEEERSKVTEVLSGDTFVIETGETVSLIGINAPDENESYYNESSDFLRNLILSKDVILESDSGNEDSYGRLLRYASLDSGTSEDSIINVELVKLGYAKPRPLYPNFKYRLEIEEAWKECLQSSVNLCFR